MREIKFRGQAVNPFDNWVFGSLIIFKDCSTERSTYTIQGDGSRNIIITKTLGQFTGLQDKDGKEIYEGDLLRDVPKSDWDMINYSCFEVFFHDGDANSDYNIGYTMNRMHNHGSVCGGYIPSFKPKQVSKMIVIGNIYENPELLDLKTK